MSLSHSTERMSWMSASISSVTPSSSSRSASSRVKIPDGQQQKMGLCPNSTLHKAVSKIQNVHYKQNWLSKFKCLVTEELTDSVLIAEVLVDQFFTWGRDRSQDSDTVLHLSLLDAADTFKSPADAAVLIRVNIWGRGRSFFICWIRVFPTFLTSHWKKIPWHKKS